jgi:transposase
MDAILGIDVSKASFDVFLLKGKGKHKKFLNTIDGFEKLSNWLISNDVQTVHACMEATGRYGRRLCKFLHQAGHKVSVVNPGRIWGFRKSETLGRNKTDKVDAALIARYCVAMQPALWNPTPEEIEQLQDLVRYGARIQEMIVAEKNRLQSDDLSAQVIAAIERHIEFLEQNAQQVKADIKKLISDNAALNEKAELLLSIPGIGKDTAAIILAEVIGAGDFKNQRSVACYAGLSPRHHTSGTSVHGRSRLSKVGNSNLRKALYFPAMCIWRDRSVFKEFISGLEQRGKPRMVILGALMRKLLGLAFVILKSGQPFDPNHSRFQTSVPA